MLLKQHKKARESKAQSNNRLFILKSIFDLTTVLTGRIASFKIINDGNGRPFKNTKNVQIAYASILFFAEALSWYEFSNRIPTRKRIENYIKGRFKRNCPADLLCYSLKGEIFPYVESIFADRVKERELKYYTRQFFHIGYTGVFIPEKCKHTIKIEKDADCDSLIEKATGRNLSANRNRKRKAEGAKEVTNLFLTTVHSVMSNTHKYDLINNNKITLSRSFFDLLLTFQSFPQAIRYRSPQRDKIFFENLLGRVKGKLHDPLPLRKAANESKQPFTRVLTEPYEWRRKKLKKWSKPRLSLAFS